MLKEILRFPKSGYADGFCLEVKNPFNLDVVAEVQLVNAAAIRRAVAIAQESFARIMRDMPAYERSKILLEAAHRIRCQSHELASMITLECGKPIKESRVEVERAASTFEIASREAFRLDGEQIPMDVTPLTEKHFGVTVREPIGLVAGITPFNFPLNLVAHKVAPALAAGNCVLLKPSSQAPISTFLLAEILKESGLPDGVLHVLPCRGGQATELVKDAALAMVTFTGSPEVGWQVRSNVHSGVRTILELGGNAGMIVHSDADLKAASKAAVRGGFAYAGQICISVQRVYVQEDVFNEFLDIFLQDVCDLKVGDPMDDQTDVGPLIDMQSVERTIAWLKQAKLGGARIMTGGKTASLRLLEPTVLVDTLPDMKVVAEEVFAPVVSVIKYSTIDDAISAMNHSRFGLQAGVFTKNINTAFTVARRLDVGGVMVNDAPSLRADHMPYGGRKQSGLGLEGVKYAVEEMTQPKFISLNLS